MTFEVFHGGVPTKPDVDKIIKNIGTEPGDSIPYIRIAELLELDPKSNRFKTVTNAWRKRLFRERLLQIEAFGEAFHVLTPQAAVSVNVTGFRKIGRATGRLTVKAEAIDSAKLTGADLDRCNLLRRNAASIRGAMSQAFREIATPKPIEALPMRFSKRD